MVLEFPVVYEAPNDYRTLVIRSKNTLHPFNALIDTGASMPMWMQGEATFLDTFPDADICVSNSKVKGVTGETESVRIYCIPYLHLTDGSFTLTYKNVYVAVPKEPMCFSFDLLLSYTMLRGLKLTVDYTDTPYISIEYNKDNEAIEIYPVSAVDPETKEVYINHVCAQNQQLSSELTLLLNNELLRDTLSEYGITLTEDLLESVFAEKAPPTDVVDIVSAILQKVQTT